VCPRSRRTTRDSATLITAGRPVVW
jgi:hypothetical protein